MMYVKDDRQIGEFIGNREARICVIGLGTIGLPVAIHFANVGFEVKGLDIDSDKVARINSGSQPSEYSNLLDRVVKRRKLFATANPKEAIEKADAVFVCVPTPLTPSRDIDLTAIEAAVENVAKYMKRGIMLIIESAVTPGTTMSMARKIERHTDYRLGKDFGAAACPERYNPGLPNEEYERIIYKGTDTHIDPIFTLPQIARVVGGTDEKSSAIAKGLYDAFIEAKVTIVSSPDVAEATKLLENIFRDVNIALANELSKVFTALDLDTYEVIEAATTKPFAFLPHYPGPGVGGECIPVDTWYLIRAAEKRGVDTSLMRTARAVNDSMPSHTVEITRKALEEIGIGLKRSNICLLGVTYKKNIADIRNSPALDIIRMLVTEGATVFACDPLISEESKRKIGIEFRDMDKAFHDIDAVIMVTDHDRFNDIDLSQIKSAMRKNILIDCRNYFPRDQAISYGFRYKGIGKRL